MLANWKRTMAEATNTNLKLRGLTLIIIIMMVSIKYQKKKGLLNLIIKQHVTQVKRLVN